jgi:DNA-3-methyladenine glycosylase
VQDVGQHQSYSIGGRSARGETGRALDGTRRMTGGARRRGVLPRDFYTRIGVLTVARDLLGRRLVVPAADGTRVAGIIVETEAYRGPADRASHAYGGRRTRRTETMYRVGGTAYVYFVYGMHHQFNVVTGVAEVPHAVLVRALEPTEGVALMRERRRGATDRELTSGPGKLCQALGIDRALDAADLLGPQVWIERGERPLPLAAIARGPRVGIDYAEKWAAMPWRFWIRENAFVSRAGAGHRSGRQR